MDVDKASCEIGRSSSETRRQTQCRHFGEKYTVHRNIGKSDEEKSMGPNKELDFCQGKLHYSKKMPGQGKRRHEALHCSRYNIHVAVRYKDDKLHVKKM